jgi:hypothetical protein
MLRARAGALGLVLCVLQGVRLAAAQGVEGGGARVDCPALGAEPESSLLARAQAELLVRAPTGRLSISCRDGVATLGFAPSGGPLEATELTLPAEPRAAVDRLLEAIDARLPALPARAPAAPAPPPPAPAVAMASAPGPRQSASARERVGVELGMGAEAEAWSSAALGALGPRLAAAWAPEPLWALRLSGGPSWALRAPEGVRGLLLRLEVGAEIRLGPGGAFRIAASILGERLSVTSSDQGTEETALGGIARATLGTWLGGVRVSGGPTLGLHPGGVRVELGSRELYRIPSVTGGLILELQVAPWDGS